MDDLNIRPLDGPYGVVVTGRNAFEMNDGELRRIADLLFHNRVLVLEDQEIDLASYVAFGRRWGEPVLLIASKNRQAEFPELIVQSNSTAVPNPVRNVANHWHCDSSYETVPATVTMLLGAKAPREGGQTLFADLVAAFEDLSPSDQSRLQSLHVRHAVSAATPAADERIVRPEDLPPELNVGTTVPDPVVQPLVRVHPVTGRKALYGLGGSAFGIVGMDEAEGSRLIAELKAHASQAKFVQQAKLLPGQILMWDNFSVMHRATHIEYGDDPEQARLNYRISVKGLPSFMGNVEAGSQPATS